jgi:hypothetical protein
MTKLTEIQRDRLKTQQFVFPEKKAYPIENAAHARDALAMGARYASPAKDAKIKKVVHKDYPKIKISGMKKKK